MLNSEETLLVVGLGSIGRRHINIIRDKFPKIKLVALRHRKCSEAITKELGLIKCVSSEDEAIALKPKAAIISNPATFHINIAKRLAINGVHLLIEKPISNSVDGVKELIDICNNNELILMVAYNLRFFPSLIKFKELINRSKVGRIISVHSIVGQNLEQWRPSRDYRLGVSSNKHLGGGVLLELSHEIDYLSWIFGPISWFKSHYSKQSDMDIDVEDNANIIFGFGNYKPCPITATLIMDFYRHDPIRTCTVIGSNGTIVWDGISGKIKFFSKNDKNWKTIFEGGVNADYTYIKEIESFFMCIENENTISSAATGEEALESVKLIEAIKASNNTESEFLKNI